MTLRGAGLPVAEGRLAAGYWKDAVADCGVLRGGVAEALPSAMFSVGVALPFVYGVPPYEPEPPPTGGL